MAAEDLLVDDGRDREAIEAVGERLPQLDVVSPLACTTHTHTQTLYIEQVDNMT